MPFHGVKELKYHELIHIVGRSSRSTKNEIAFEISLKFGIEKGTKNLLRLEFTYLDDNMIKVSGVDELVRDDPVSDCPIIFHMILDQDPQRGHLESGGW